MSRAMGLVLLVLTVLAVAVAAIVYRHPTLLSRPASQLAAWRPRAVEASALQPADTDNASLEGMRRSERLLWKTSGGLKPAADAGAAAAPASLDPLVAEITRNAESVSEQNGFKPEEVREGRLIAMRAYFIGARTWPDKYGKAFLDRVQTMIVEKPGSEDAAQAEALAFLYLHRLDRPIQRELLQDLDVFTATYANSPMALSLYKTASEQLMQNGQTDSAKALLKHGLETYRHRPQANQLLSLFVDQGHAPPFAPQVTEKSLRACAAALAAPTGGRSRAVG